MRCALGVTIVLAMSAARTSRAQESSSNATIARDYYLAGQAAYQAGDYAAAALAFEEADRALPDPATVFSLAQAYRQLYVQLHDSSYAARAVELYEQYLDRLPKGRRAADAREFVATLATLLELAKYRGDDVSAKSLAPRTQLMVWSRLDGARGSVDGGEHVALPLVVDTVPGVHTFEVIADGHELERLEIEAIDGRLVAMEAAPRPRPAELRVRRPRGAWLAIDGERVADRGDGVRVPPGRHRIDVGRRGRTPASRDVVVGPGATQSLDIDLHVSPRRRRATLAFVGGGALAVAAAGTFAYASVHANKADDLLALRSTRAWTNDQHDDYMTHRAATARWSAASAVLAGSAIAVTAVGAYLFIADNPSPAGRTTILPAIGDTGASVSVIGSF